jgi:hypothetical protein
VPYNCTRRPAIVLCNKGTGARPYPPTTSPVGLVAALPQPYPLFEFNDLEEAVRPHCGRREEGRFETNPRKGAIARATLYFLLRLPERSATRTRSWRPTSYRSFSDCTNPSPSVLGPSTATPRSPNCKATATRSSIPRNGQAQNDAYTATYIRGAK